MAGITILDRIWVTDSQAPGGRKEVVTFSVATAALIDEILTFYPGTGDGSFAICFSESVFKNLIDGAWV